MANRHILRSINSSIEIHSSPEKIWSNITNVQIEQFSDPLLFKLLDIPKPLKAEVLQEANGITRIAYFDSGKRFLQKIIVWKPLVEYSFSFNPEKGFRVCYVFDLYEGPFRILEGAYFLKTNSGQTTLKLTTNYSINSSLYLLFNLPARMILKIFQRYLLNSIKKNSE